MRRAAQPFDEEDEFKGHKHVSRARGWLIWVVLVSVLALGCLAILTSLVRREVAGERATEQIARQSPAPVRLAPDRMAVPSSSLAKEWELRVERLEARQTQLAATIAQLQHDLARLTAQQAARAPTPALLASPVAPAPVPDLVKTIMRPRVLQRTRAAAERNQDQRDVIEAVRWAWDAYRSYAWGRDELKPVAKSWQKWTECGLTIVDSLDTLLLMGMQSEFEEAREWVASKLSFDYNDNVNLFETTIRVLGGLLAAYDLSGDAVMLSKATELGDRLLFALDSSSGIPFSDVNLATHHASSPDGGMSSLAEVTSIQLEFAALSAFTGDSKYVDRADAVMRKVFSLPSTDGLLPIRLYTATGTASGVISLGSRGDSYYEYLLKQFLHARLDSAPELRNGSRSDTDLPRECFSRYVQAIAGVRAHLIRHSVPNGLTFVAELNGGALSPKMDHLVCFLPGTLALGTRYGAPAADLDLAAELMQTCMAMYRATPTGLAPEIVYFNEQPGSTDDITIHPADRHYLLRPETVESLFYMHRVTGDPKYRTWGREIFDALNKHARVASGGFTSLSDVTVVPPVVGSRDKMESFFLAETLKYLYLLFDDDVNLLAFDAYVFNTEGHPLPVLASARAQ